MNRDWLTKTAKNYDSTRYGGYSFGEVDTFAQFNFTVWKDGLRAMVEQAQQNGEPVPHESGLQGRWHNLAKLLSGMFTKDNIKVWFNNRKLFLSAFSRAQIQLIYFGLRWLGQFGVLHERNQQRHPP